MKVILCKPNMKPQVVDIPKNHTYLDIKRLLEIESPLTCVRRKIGNCYYDFWCDDEGLYPEEKYMSGFCKNASELLCGNILIACNDNEGNLIGLTKEQREEILDDNNYVCNKSFIDFRDRKMGNLRLDGKVVVATDYVGFGCVYLHEDGYMLKYSI